MERLTAIGGFLGDSIVSACVEKLLEMLGSTELMKYAGEGGISDEMNNWEKKLKKLYVVLDDAEEKQWANPLVKMWVTDLRNLAYDVDDLLDEFAIEVQLRKLRSQSEARPSKLRRIFSTVAVSLNLLGTVRFNAEMVSKMEEISCRLDEILKDKDDFNLGGFANCSRVRARLSPTCLVNEAEIHGRENDLIEIIELLKIESSVKVSVIPIVGMGGLGKTTLTQLVYNDNSLEFDLKAWVCVGEDFDVIRITKMILQTVEGHDEKKDLNGLQVKLKEMLYLKKFLIVLDDVWTESYEDWLCLCAPFTVGAQGSAVIITTRNQVVSSMVGTVPAYTLKELSYDACMSVFAQHALDAKNFDNHMHLKELGARIVKKCQGLPLAAKALGGLLHGKLHPNVWMGVLESEIWADDKSNILPALSLSYFHLPSHLKQCFAYCANFPKDYEFDINELVLLWMAEGFLYQPRKMKHLEDIGCQYFHDLLSRSFFQRSCSNKLLYVMHDLMNDLARHVSTEICFQMGDELDDEKSYANIRHSSFNRHEFGTWQKFEVFLKMKSLRTFLALPIMTSYCTFSYLSRKVLYELVPSLKRLRVLSLAGYRFVELPNSIEALKHLRYLDLSYTAISRLPEWIVNFLNLQTLRLSGCDELTELPLGIGNLINLRCLDMRECQKLTKLPLGIGNLTNLQCLDISDTYELKEMPPQLGNLKNLHTLTKFIVGKDNGLKLTELKKLSQLQGRLHIAELQNVVNIRDANFAVLKAKHGIKELRLQWANISNDSRNLSDEVKVLNSLKPHQNLSSLSIRGFGGTKFPSWIGDPTLINLVQLKLGSCTNITLLPPLGQLPSLKELGINGLNGVAKVGTELYGEGSCFASLEILNIECMRNWEQWSFSNDLKEEAAVRFPKLHDLRVINCPKLVSRLPSCLPSLQRLVVGGCHKAVLENLPHLPSLTNFEVWEISGLVSVDELHIQNLVALQDLRISWCKEVRCLWKDGTNLNKLASLKCLDIFKCEQLVSLVEGEEGQLPCYLQALRVNSCCNLEYLPNGLCRLRCLEVLMIDDCEKLSSFPETGVPYCLRHLEIRGCNRLLSLPVGIMSHGTNRNQKSLLEKLLIEDCKSLSYSPDGDLPNSLKILSIRKCKWPIQLLVSLCTKLSSPEGFSCLIELEIGDCNWLYDEGEFTIDGLNSLTIDNSKNLMPLANPNLISLETLVIDNCKAFQKFPEGGLPPNITNLQISDCVNLEPPISDWGLYRLTSLVFSLHGSNPVTDRFVSFPDDDCLFLPSSLTHLSISAFKNLKSISRSILNLASLRHLDIWSCPNLSYLPDEGLPATLEVLSIWKCPLLKKRCLKHGEYWPVISHIPLISVDGKNGNLPSGIL